MSKVARSGLLGIAPGISRQNLTPGPIATVARLAGTRCLTRGGPYQVLRPVADKLGEHVARSRASRRQEPNPACLADYLRSRRLPVAGWSGGGAMARLLELAQQRSAEYLRSPDGRRSAATGAPGAAAPEPRRLLTLRRCLIGHRSIHP
jgi:hypothetical protein